MLLGDPAFVGLDYVVAGFKPSEIHGDAGRVIFDRISRSEQKAVENVNKFFKDARSVNRQDVFRHSEEKLLLCVIIATGFYNLRRTWGYFEPLI